jgi:PhnB protein
MLRALSGLDWSGNPIQENQKMPSQVKPIPQGYRTVTPYLTLNDTARAIDFYKRAFGAQEVMRMDMPGGKIAHAEIKIGDSIIMLGDEMPGMGSKAPQSLGGTCSGIMLYVEDVDAAFEKATAAGAQVDSPLADMFWGDRYGRLRDPFGHLWSVATHKEDVAPAEMSKRMQAEVARRQQQHTQSAR